MHYLTLQIIRRQWLVVALSILLAIFLISGVKAQSDCPLPIQEAYKAPNQPAVYYVTESCTKRAFNKPAIYFTYFPSWSDVQTNAAILSIPDDSLGFMPYGPLYELKAGSLAKTVGDPKVYVILEGVKKWVASEAVFNAIGYQWSWVQDVDPRLLDTFVSGGEISSASPLPNYTLIKYVNDPRIYRLIPSPDDVSQQVAQYIKSEAIFNALGYRFDRVVELPGANPYSDALTSEDDLSYGQLKLNTAYYVDGPLTLEEVEALVVDCLDQMSETGQCSLSFECFTEQDCADRKYQINSYVEQVQDQAQKELAEKGSILSQAAEILKKRLIVTYKIENGYLTKKQVGELAAMYPEQLADDIAHDRIWDMVKIVLPTSLWQQFEEFQVFTDQQYAEIAYVTQVGTINDQWVIGFDTADTPTLVNSISESVAKTIVHEAAHMITLDRDQMQASQVPILLTDNAEDIERKQDIAYLSCQPNYYTDGACTKEASYMNRFYNLFWIGVGEDPRVDPAIQAQTRYISNPDDFESPYAATSVEEDIAESFTAFVFGARPATPANLREEKINFFYTYPELVTLRTELRSGIVQAGGKNYLK